MCNSIVETVAAHASEHPQLRCMAEMNKICTYGELWAQILHNAACLKKHGVEKGDRVILHSSQTIWHAAALLAIHLVGGVAVPVEKKIALDRMTEIAQSVEAKLVVAPRKLDIEYPVLTRADLEAFEAEDNFSYAFPHREDMCDILFTTGTTGKSKGVIRTHANELACAQSVAAYGDLDENEVALVPFPLNHSGGIGRLYACLIAKTLMIPTDGVVFVQTFYSLMDKYGVTIMFLAPAHLSILLNRSEEHLKTYDGKLRMVTIGSSYLDEATRQRLLTVLPNVKLYITYGATESSSACSFEFSKYRNKPRCIGLPNVNTKILITDENGVEIRGANAENPGFIAHDGPTVVPGYWKEPELTASVIKNGRLVTHDMGYIDDEGFVYIYGRMDDVIISGGNKIAPFEIEDIVMGMPEILECACIPVDDPLLGAAPKLYVVLRESYELDVKRIILHLQSKLEHFKVPNMIAQIDEIPKTPGTNKINRKALIEYDKSCKE